MESKLLELKNISKKFPGVQALDEVSLDLQAGEVLGLVGENGAGKSTLIKILSGDYNADEGDIYINELPAEFSCPSDSQEKGIRIIHQEINTFDSLSVSENIFAGDLPVKKWSGRVDWKAMDQKARSVLKQMDADIDPNRTVSELSIHKKQVIEIAKAIYHKAEILVMDEPTAALNEKDTQMLLATIRKLKSQGVGIIFVSHRLEEVFQITDRITVLRDGKKVGTVDTKETNKNHLISMMVGSELETFFNKREVPLGPPVLEVTDLTIKDILKDVSFQIRKGEIVGLFGLIGSGQINIIRALYGLEKIDSGQISISGKKVSIGSPQEGLQHKIGFMPIDRKAEALAPEMSVAANITMANIDRIGKGIFFNRGLETKQAKKWVRDVAIKSPSINTEVNNLSGGNQQKIVLAKLLETGSEVFLMSEPTRGIDVGAKKDIYEMMECLCEAGAAILIMSSDMEEILAMPDRILVISEGKITGQFDRTEADQQKLLHAAT